MIVGALVGLVGWVGVRALLAKQELETAQTLLSQLQVQATGFDIDGAKGTLKEITAHSDAAVSLTNDPGWWLFSLIPVVGQNFSAVHDLAAAAQSTITDVAVPLVGVLAVVDPASLAPKDGAIDLQPFVDAIPAVADANEGAQAAIATVARIDVSTSLGPVVAAKEKVSKLLDEIAPLLETANRVLPMLPPALGSEGPRTYVIMFENNAEARALGGTALSFALMDVDQGKISLRQTIAAGLQNFTDHAESVVPVPDGAIEVYPGNAYGKFIANVTLRPDFQTAAEMTQEMWRLQFGYTVDGIISIDPVALSYILKATDPIALSSGDTLTSESLVPLLLNGIYQRYNSGDVNADNLQQDAIYGEAVGATFARLTSGALNPTIMFAAITQSVNERRIMLWSSHEEEQAEIVELGVQGALPKSDDKVDRVGVYFQDNVGSKMNYYLQQTVHLAEGACRADGRANYRVIVELGNGIQPADVPTLSPSVLGAYKAESLEPGVQRMIVMLYAPPGSQIVAASVDGQPIDVGALHDTDYPVGKATVVIQPGAVGHVSFDVVAATAGDRTLDALITPLVNRTTVSANEALDCATVPAS